MADFLKFLKKGKGSLINQKELLEEQILRTQTILDSSSNTFLLTITLDNKISSYNKHCSTYFLTIFKKEIQAETSYIDFLSDIISPSRLRLLNWFFRDVKKGKDRQFELKLDLNNSEYWLEIFMNPIFDIHGKTREISIVAHDISDKKENEKELKESLKEKEILLKEIHHRVKNNLQVISSILNLQSSFVEDDKTLTILQESRNRIRSMAIIHENLYRTEDYSSINFSSYLKTLANDLLQTYRIKEDINLETNLKEVDLVLDQAIPCGLLVNELISNALKHAWKEGEKGTILIKLTENENVVLLEVEDDGIGLGFDINDVQSETLGLQLILTLVEQLEGEIKTEVENGTKYLIKFDKTKPHNHV